MKVTFWFTDMEDNPTKDFPLENWNYPLPCSGDVIHCDDEENELEYVGTVAYTDWYVGENFLYEAVINVREL